MIGLGEVLGYVIKDQLFLTKEQLKKAGPKISLLGGLALIITGLGQIPYWSNVLTYSFEYFPLLIEWIMTLIIGICACSGAILSLKNHTIGKYLVLISGIIATVGIFIPIGMSYKMRCMCATPVYLVAIAFFIEPYLILIGGIVTFYYKNREFTDDNTTY